MKAQEDLLKHLKEYHFLLFRHCDGLCDGICIRNYIMSLEEPIIIGREPIYKIEADYLSP